MPLLCDAGLRPSEWRTATPGELHAMVAAWLRAQSRAAEDRAWTVAHLLRAFGAAPRGLPFDRLLTMLLGRAPGTGAGDAPRAPDPEPPGALAPDQAVAWMRAFVAAAKTRVAGARVRTHG
jgi:hypothetical protein